MNKNLPAYLIVHHTGGIDSQPLIDTSHHTFSMVNADHKARWNFKSSLGFYIGYHYFIDKNGVVTQGRADTDEGAHTINYNNKSIGICMAGNFDATLPTEVQIEALKALLTKKMAQYSIPIEKVVPHRRFAVKSCYGNRLSDSWLKEILQTNESQQQEANARAIQEIKNHLTEVDKLLGKIK